MKITGNWNLAESPKTVWENILDPEVLARITPNVKELTSKSDDHYYARSEVKVGPIRGTFIGDLFIQNKDPEKGATIVLIQKSKIGNATVEIDMKLHHQEDGSTRIEYDGKANISGMLARMGQRLLGGVVKTLSKEFFHNLEEELNNKPSKTT